MKSGAGVGRAILYLFFGVLVARLIIAALVPVVQDEAYYIEWSKALDWGYFDHPPLIAWVNVTSWFAPSSVLMGRLGAVLVATLAFPFLVGLFRKAGLTQKRGHSTFSVDPGGELRGPGEKVECPLFRAEATGLLVALLYANLNVYVFMSGLLTTPDAVQLLLWCIALHEAAAALAHDRRRWVTAGLAAGVGLMGKYTMVLIGPVFLWGIVRGDARALRTPWPYVGVLAAIVGFGPHLVWSAQHDWVGMRMQLQHGLAEGHDPGFALSTDLPAPQKPAPEGPELRLGRAFGATIPTAAPAPRAESPWWETIKHVANYWGGVVVVWGAFLGVLAHRFVLRLRRRSPPAPPLHPAVRPLLVAATWAPILLFGVLSLKSKIEANWAAIYVIGAAALLAESQQKRARDIAIHGVINVACCVLLALYAYHPLGTPKVAERLFTETAGWRELAQYVGQLPGPILTDREQPTSMIRFYQPQLKVAQWPGLSQPSEFIRRPEWNYYTCQSLREQGGFWLISGGALPPHLEGFEPVEEQELRFRLDSGLTVRKAPLTQPVEISAVQNPLRIWYAIRYRVADAQTL